MQTIIQINNDLKCFIIILILNYNYIGFIRFNILSQLIRKK